jgi:hypothetical protein
MLRKDNFCWIKIEPLKQISSTSSIHIILNGEVYNWDVYDETNKVVYIIYFKGINCEPCFYLKTNDKSFRIECNYNEIKIYPITSPNLLKTYIKEYCSCKSSDASCWAKSLYNTSRPDKTPFDLM